MILLLSVIWRKKLLTFAWMESIIANTRSNNKIWLEERYKHVWITQTNNIGRDSLPFRCRTIGATRNHFLLSVSKSCGDISRSNWLMFKGPESTERQAILSCFCRNSFLSLNGFRTSISMQRSLSMVTICGRICILGTESRPVHLVSRTMAPTFSGKANSSLTPTLTRVVARDSSSMVSCITQGHTGMKAGNRCRAGLRDRERELCWL